MKYVLMPEVPTQSMLAAADKAAHLMDVTGLANRMSLLNIIYEAMRQVAVQESPHVHWVATDGVEE